jgi:FKBP-type peptidyl-prolyl cis-trans isomerase
MKRIIIIAIAIVSVAQAQVKKDTTGKKVLATKGKITLTAPVIKMTADDSLSYALGLEGATYYNSQGITKLNTVLVKKAFDDVYNKKTPLLTKEQADMTIQKKLQEFMEAKTSKEKEEGKKFLAENKKRKGVIELPSGLQYEILKDSAGERPTDTSTVKAHYIGTLLNGQEFDNSYKRGQPLEIPVSGVIKGWTEALKLMRTGSKWKLYIPAELAYGDRGAGNGAIPGGATLIFEVELISIVKK